MPAPQKIKELVERFTHNYDYYQSADYNEEDLRHDFLNPFFKALGWDMEDKRGLGPRRDVRYEKRIRAGAPDFGFYIDGKRRFFVEAKNPSVNVCSNLDAAYQLRSYGWSAKHPRNILTDFEELAIYDCTVRPKASDDSRVARLDCIKYEQYIERWDEIAALFSRDAVAVGSLEKLEKEHAKQAVDDDFLEDISRWREILAKNIALRNNKITEEQLNRAVQDTLDRIIFLRICEDRNIEPVNRLLELSEQKKIYTELLKIFKKANERYDSSLFKVGSEEDILVDDEALKIIISELYFPKSPYRFNVISADILGKVYEQFLGKVIRLTAGHHVKIEEKPEVRRAGGVYYTPPYIVEYIVENTVGKLLDGKNPKTVANLSVLDPACGSGSFLIGAYQYLMDWYRDWYVSHDAIKHEKRKIIYRDDEGQWQIALAERKRILAAHIYGVDIDRQAVEVTKLSLMLKALEAPEQLSLFNDRLLPELDKNIKCGNSLIGHDFYEGKNISIFDNEEMRKINAFDWQKEFSDIFANGGFDVVIGNPPYIFTRELISENEKKYFYNKYNNTQFKLNTYILFTEKSFNLLNKRGILGFIIPNNWLSLETASDFRKFILTNVFDIKIVNNVDKFFNYPSVDNCILVYNKFGKDNITIYELKDGDINFNIENSRNKYLKSHNFVINYGNQDSESILNILNKINSISDHLDIIAEVKNGVQAYTVGEGTPKQTKEMKQNRIYHSLKKKNNLWIKYVDGVDVKRYFIGWSKQFIKYGKNLSRPRRPDLFQDERILVRQIPSKPPYSILACCVKENLVNDNNSMIVKIRKDIKFGYKYIIGLLNSKLISFWFLNTFGKLQRKIFPQFKINELSIFPIVKIDLDRKEDKVKHGKIVNFVDQMLEVQKKFHSAKTEADKKIYQQKIDILDKQIDQEVYKLYGLAEEERRIIEGK